MRCPSESSWEGGLRAVTPHHAYQRPDPTHHSVASAQSQGTAAASAKPPDPTYHTVASAS